MAVPMNDQLMIYLMVAGPLEERVLNIKVMH
jgi:hypothetical protein